MQKCLRRTIQTLTLGTSCLVLVASASGASAQPLQGPAPAVCAGSPSPTLGQGDPFAPKPTTCSLKCVTSEGGTTDTLYSLGGSCATIVPDLASRLTAAANAACHNLTGFAACNVVLHTTGCLPDGDPQYFIDSGNATYNCKDTSC